MLDRHRDDSMDGDDEIEPPGLGIVLKGLAAVGGSKLIHAYPG